MYVFVVMKSEGIDYVPSPVAVFSGTKEGEIAVKKYVEFENNFILIAKKFAELFYKNVNKINFDYNQFSEPEPKKDPAITAIYHSKSSHPNKEIRKENQRIWDEYNLNFKTKIYKQWFDKKQKWDADRKLHLIDLQKDALKITIEKFFSEDYLKSFQLDYESFLSIKERILCLVEENDGEINICVRNVYFDFQKVEFKG